MADNNKSILEQALSDAKKIQEALNANTKEILRSVAREEIDGLVKESLNEDYEEEDVDGDELETGAEEETGEDAGEELESGEEDVEVDVDAVDVDDSEVEGDDIEGDYETGTDAVASDEFEMDMTDATDEDVIAVYKKLTGDDEIEVVVDDENGDVTLKVNEPGEFVIKAPQGGGADVADVEGDDFGADLEAGDDFGAEMGVEPEMDMEPEMGGEEEYQKDEVVYEIALDEDVVRTATGDINNAMTGDLAKGEIEGQKAPQDSDSGDNLDGGFDDNAVSHANAEGPTVMSEEEISEEDEAEGEEAIEEKIQVGKGRNVTNNKTEIVGAGGNANNVKAPNVTVNEATNKYKNLLNESNKKYNSLLSEATELKSKNGEYKEALKNFRTMLAETVVFNSNLTYVTKLFMEHSTTKEEKEAIFKRFDNEVSNLKESKKLFKTIGSELSARKPINESIGNKLNKGVTTSASNQLNESTAYVDKETSRIMDLMKRVNNR